MFLLLVLRIPVFFSQSTEIVPQLNWMLVGEKINAGNLIYRDFDENLSFASAIVYAGIDLLFGRSQLAYQIVAMVLLFLQSMLFTFGLNRLDVLKDKSYLPALFFILLGSAFYDLYTLTPIMMATTFLIPAFIRLLQLLKFGNQQQGIFMVGIYIGIATLFYFPVITFFLLAFSAMLFYTSSPLKSYMVLIITCLFPTLLVASGYYWFGGLRNFLLFNFYYSFGFSKDNYMDTSSIVTIYIIPLIFAAIAIFKVSTGTGFINFQVRSNRLGLVWFGVGILAILLATEISAYHFYVFIPMAAFYLSNFFVSISKIWQRELSYYVLVLCILSTAYNYLFDFYKHIDTTELDVKRKEEQIEGKILVLGDNRDFFIDKGNTAATAYLNWRIAKRHFDDLDNMATIANIYENFEKDMPDFIYDENDYCPKLFYRIPALEQQYKPLKEQLFVRIESH